MLGLVSGLWNVLQWLVVSGLTNVSSQFCRHPVLKERSSIYYTDEHQELYPTA
jgi:hypothetical protein